MPPTTITANVSMPSSDNYKPTQMDQEPLITIENVSKTFYIREQSQDSIREKVINLFSNKGSSRAIKALDNINLTIYKGDFIGIIGHNGSGKSTLLKMIIGAFQPDKGGTITTKGKIARLALGMGFDPNLSARDNIYVNGSIMGLSFKQIGERFHGILTFAELEDFVDTPIKFFSSGMVSRLAFAIAMHIDANILLVDEFFGGVGDIGFREKSQKVFKEAFIDGRTIVYVSHDLETIQQYCNCVLVLEKGKLIGYGKTAEMIAVYKELFI